MGIEPIHSSSPNWPQKSETNNQDAINQLVNTVANLIDDLHGQTLTPSFLKSLLSKLNDTKSKVDQLIESGGLPQKTLMDLQRASVDLEGGIWQANHWIETNTTPTTSQAEGFVDILYRTKFDLLDALI